MVHAVEFPLPGYARENLFTLFLIAMFDLADRIKSLFHQQVAADPKAEGVQEAILLRAVERVVDAMDPRLRLLPHYRDTLRPAMNRALAHLEMVVAQVVGPLDCSSHGWGGDTRMKALFATPTDVPRIFSRTDGVQAFFARPENALRDQCFGLLLASRQARKSMGYSMQGEMLTADVVQTSISFTNHRIALPAANSHAVRLELELRGVDFLAEQALIRVETEGNGRTPLEKRLDILMAMLSEADGLCSIQTLELHLNSMNQLTEAAGENGVDLSEIQAQGRPPQVVALVAFPRAELIDRRAMARDAAKFLGV